MAAVFLYHVVGDLTVGKPELVEFHDTETVESALRAIGESAEGAITVWKKQQQQLAEELKAARFVGMLNSLDVVAFIARAGDHDRAMRTPVAEVVLPNSSLLKEVDPGTRLIDALEMMKQGVRRLLVRKSSGWRGMSKRFSILYNGKWLNNSETSISGPTSNGNRPLSSFQENKYCCLSRENVIRFLIGCLGALAPLPLSSISVLGAINPHYHHIESSSPAIETIQKLPHDPCAIAVVENNPDGTHKIIGEISAYKLLKGDYLASAWAMANLSAGQLVTGAEDNNSSSSYLLDLSVGIDAVGGASARPKKFSSRSIGFFNNPVYPMPAGGLRGMYRGRSTPLMCKNTSSLAAVMAQMLSHRASHVWVTEAESNDVLVGVVSYTEILQAVTKNPNSVVPPNP